MMMTVLPPRWARSRRSTARPNFQRDSETFGDSSGPAGRFGRFISASRKSVSGFCLAFISIRFLGFVMAKKFKCLLQQRKKAKSAVDRELDSSDVITNHRKDLAPQSVMLLFGVVD